MAKDPGHVPDAAELALRSAAQLVVTEANARLDNGDIDGALDLYADDAVLEAAGEGTRGEGTRFGSR
jgi:ketosteroid isomerase-like protein